MGIVKFLATVLAAATVVCCADERVSFEETDHEEMMNAPSDAGPRAMPDARYSIGGVVDGLVGSVVLGLNSPGRDTEELTLERNGNFSFRHTLATDDEYEVVVLTQPQDEFCLVEDGAGIVDDEDVVEVFVVCDPGNPGLDNIASATP